MKFAFKYVVFAIIATVFNIGSQDIAIRVYDGAFHLAVSVFLGTLVGLIVKYVLDKRYVFDFQARNVAHDGKTFFLYTVMGLVTTAIFWLTEFGFDHVFGTKEMRYLGAVIGLSIGYVVKYRLDKAFVFRAGST